MSFFDKIYNAVMAEIFELEYKTKKEITKCIYAVSYQSACAAMQQNSPTSVLLCSASFHPASRHCKQTKCS